MKEIKIKDLELKNRFDEIWNENFKKIKNEHELLIKNILILFKRHSSNENNIALALIYLLLFFGYIEENYRLITKKDKKNIDILKKSFFYEINGDYKRFLDEILKMEDDIFLFKTTIKYNFLSFEKKIVNLIYNKEKYYKFIGYLLPYLTYKESPYLGFFQDMYFKNIYPRKYEKIKKYYIEKILKVEFPGEHIFTVVNNTTNIMRDSNVIGKTTIRKKTYYSIYNKLIRKKGAGILDTIGMRIVFKDINDLKSYSRIFEEKYVFINKKDYILFPKENGYKSLHYRYISPYRDTQIMVELQLRTLEIEKEINTNSLISHFQYTINNKKWSKLFKEVHKGFNYISKKLINK